MTAHFLFYSLTGVFFFLLSTCQAQKSANEYYEDLSPYRPKLLLEKNQKKENPVQYTHQENIEPRKSVNEKVNFVLDSIDRFNLTRKFVDGYTIQIYSGQRRDEALNVQKQLTEEDGQYAANIQYQQPKFKVTVGKYFTRIEAQKDLLVLKKIFPAASLVPERIMIK
ncbi:MAG: SPOR domain-containing protein [Flammeovirgaceae bacterium]